MGGFGVECAAVPVGTNKHVVFLGSGGWVIRICISLQNYNRYPLFQYLLYENDRGSQYLYINCLLKKKIRVMGCILPQYIYFLFYYTDMKVTIYLGLVKKKEK